MLSVSHFTSVTLLLLVAAAMAAAEPIDVNQLKKAYAANNRHDVPIVLWTEGGGAPGVKYLLFADGRLLVQNDRAKSRLGTSRLSPASVSAVVAKLEAQDKFWTLSPTYRDPNIILELPDNAISLRLP